MAPRTTPALAIASFLVRSIDSLTRIPCRSLGQLQGLARGRTKRYFRQPRDLEPTAFTTYAPRRTGVYGDRVVVMRDGVAKLPELASHADPRQFLGRRQVPEPGHVARVRSVLPQQNLAAPA